MKRLEDLTQKRLDGTLTRSEERELAALLERDAEAFRIHRQLLDVEVALRDLDEEFDVSEQVMARIAPIGGTVRPGKVGTERPIDWWFLRIAMPIAAAAGMALAFVLFHQVRSAGSGKAMASGGGQATVEGIEVTRAGSGQPVSGSVALQPGDRLLARSGTEARLRYGDQTEVRLAEGTEVVFEPGFRVPEAASKRLELLSGTLRAEVPRQSGGAFVLKSPHALAIVRGTVFRLSTVPGQTRLSVDEGKVELRRSEDGAMVLVEAGKFAVVPGKGDLVSRPQRVGEGLEAYFTFEEGRGETVRDRSGAGEANDLNPAGRTPSPPRWESDGRKLPPGGWLASEDSVRRIADSCRYTGEVTLEAWIRPGDTTRSGPAWIAALAGSDGQLNLLLGHGPSKDLPDAYTLRIRTSKDGNGATLHTPKRSVAAKLTHLVCVRERDGDTAIYLDGKRVAARKMDGNLSNWHSEVALLLGGSPDGKAPGWDGHYRLIALYSRALSPKEVSRNFASGPDQLEGGVFP